MLRVATTSFFIRKYRLALLLAAAGTLLCAQTAAADLDPFQMDTAHWKSFDRYKEDYQNSLWKGEKPPETTTEDKTTTEPEPIAPQPPDMKSADGESPLAPPTRAVSVPVMPGMNKDFEVKIDTTSDDKKPVAQITNIDQEPQVQVSQNWETADEAARRIRDGETPALDVRMTFLPASMRPTAEKKFKAPRSAMPAVAMPKQTPKPAPKTAAEAAACAAIDNYKKQQLQALEGDRKTLQALQEAIAKLGLQKELNFMANPESGVNPQADAPLSVNAEVPSIIPAKN